MDHLEKYVLENRDDFDQVEAVPEEAMWLKIRAGKKRPTPPARTGPNWKMLALAGFVLALAGWGILFFKKQPSAPAALPPEVEMPVAQQEQPLPEIASPLLAEAEKKEHTASPDKKTVRKKPSGKPAAPVPVVSEQERQMQQLVNLKKQEIGFDQIDPAAFADLFRELNELEISVEQARQDFHGMPQKERLVETLVKYYELKIRILEQISYEFNKQQYHENLEKRI